MEESLELNLQPAILISLSGKHHQEALSEVMFGIEEEGIPYRLEEIKKEDVLNAAYDAARRSDLSVGLSCDQESIVVHFRNLPMEYPLFSLSRYHLKDKQILRSLGSNAARLVKRTPFKDLTEIGESG